MPKDMFFASVPEKAEFIREVRIKGLKKKLLVFEIDRRKNANKKKTNRPG